jgi:hypothetical protein
VIGLREEFRKLIVGFALERALIYNQDTKELEKLYNDPEEKKIQEQYSQLIGSRKHQERALAIWLSTALKQKPLRNNPDNLVKELRKLEYLLYNLMNQLVNGKKQVNNWMNYVLNAAQLLEDGFYLDAKVMLSRALQESEKKEVTELKNHPKLRYEVNVFQQATRSYFNEVEQYPVNIKIRSHLEKILMIQEIMLKLLTEFNPEKGEEEKVSKEAIIKISSGIRYLWGKSYEKAETELFLAVGYMERWLECLDVGERDKMLSMLKSILEFAESI